MTIEDKHTGMEAEASPQAPPGEAEVQGGCQAEWGSEGLG